MNALSDTEPVANLAVKNLDAARKFYAETLGLKQVSEEEGDLLVFQSGDATLNVYRSDFAGTNKATAVTWAVDDVEGTVRALKGKGVTFEHYDLPQLTLKGDVHQGKDARMAWFKDPDGNILNIVNRH